VPADDDTEGEGAEAEGREEECRLPKQNIMRIMKKELPERSKIARDATSAMTVPSPPPFVCGAADKSAAANPPLPDFPSALQAAPRPPFAVLHRSS